MGFLDLLGGPFLVLAGMCCLAAFIGVERRRAAVAGRPPARLGPWPALLLLSNFPAAGTVLQAVSWVEHTAPLTVVNRTPVPLGRVVVHSDAGSYEFGPLAPGAGQACTVHGNVGNYSYSATAPDGTAAVSNTGSFGDEDSHPPGTPYRIDLER